MANQNPARKTDQQRPRHGEADIRDNPQRRPEDAEDVRRARNNPPTAAERRTGVTASPPGTEPDAAQPMPQPNTVLGTEAPPRSYRPDDVARQEVEAREAAHAVPERTQNAIPNEMLEDPDARRAGPLRFGLIVLAVVVAAALIWFLL